MSKFKRAGLRAVIAAVILAVSIGPGVPSAVAQRGKPEGLYYKSWGIVIGIDDYLFAPKRPGAIADAKAVAEALRQLDFEEVIELYDKDASSRQLRHIFKEFLPRKVGRYDRLVVYFGGHAGMTQDMDEQPLGYLVPWDVPLRKADKGLTLHDLKRFSHRIMSKHILFFLDTDVSGWEVTPPNQLSLEGRLSPEDETEKRAVQLLTAARSGESLIRTEGQGIFVRSLLAGMKGASDRDQNGWILASELGAFVAQRVTDASENAQHPQFARLDGDGDMILQEGRTGRLAADYEPTTQADRIKYAQTLYNQALTNLRNQKSAREALALLNKSISYNPALGDAYVLKSFVLLDMVPNLEGALIAGLQGVQYAPDNPDSHFTLALILQRKQEYAEAEKAFLHALDVNPSYPDVYLFLGDLYAQDLNDREKSVEAYQRYLELGGTESRARIFIEKDLPGPPDPSP